MGGCGNIINNDCSFIVGYGITTNRTNTTFVNNLTITQIPTYVDNAAALVGGLLANDVYKTATGELRIVY